MRKHATTVCTKIPIHTSPLDGKTAADSKLADELNRL